MKYIFSNIVTNILYLSNNFWYCCFISSDRKPELPTEYKPRRSRRRRGTPWHRWPAEVSRSRSHRRGAARGSDNCSAISALSGRYSAVPVGPRRARPPHSPPETSRNAPGCRPCRRGSHTLQQPVIICSPSGARLSPSFLLTLRASLVARDTR